MRGIPQTTILTSGIGLGIYIPALMIQYQLEARGCPADVEVLEEYYLADKLAAHIEHRKAYRENFALAQIAHRMAKGVQECLDETSIHKLLRRWRSAQRKHFMVWSGFWLPVLESYKNFTGFSDILIDHCRIDADVSASFRVHGTLDTGKIESDPESQNHREIWLWDGRRQRLVNELKVSPEPPVPFENRLHQLVVHGGGWGLGTYQQRANDMLNTDYDLAVVVHSLSDIKSRIPKIRYFMVDPDWNPWTRNSGGELIQPPIAELCEDSRVIFKTHPAHHEFYNVIRNSRAIVSKPGGCTLIDSLSSCTPLVILEPYGYAEASNGRIWETLGYGVSYEQWADSGFSETILEQLHENLINRNQQTIDYVEQYSSMLRHETRS